MPKMAFDLELLSNLLLWCSYSRS